MGPSWLQVPKILAVKLTCKKLYSSLSGNHEKEEVKTTALTVRESCSLSPIASSQTRKNAIAEYLDYQIPVTQLKEPKTNGNMHAAKRD